MSAAGCVIVTGGGQGIGRAIARHLVMSGTPVVLAESDVEAGREAEADLAPLGPVRFHATDVADEAQVEAMVGQAAGWFGGIAGLVNNAGVSRNLPLERLTLAEWRRVIDVNLTGAFLCARQAAPHLRAAGGAIVNIASTRALMSEADTEAYAASKGGLVALTHALSVSLGPAVRVNCVSPGWIETGPWQRRAARRQPAHSPADKAQHPVGRVGTPEDVAEAVAYLLSDKAGFVTGANLVIDGGMTRRMIYV